MGALGEAAQVARCRGFAEALLGSRRQHFDRLRYTTGPLLTYWEKRPDTHVDERSKAWRKINARLGRMQERVIYEISQHYLQGQAFDALTRVASCDQNAIQEGRKRATIKEVVDAYGFCTEVEESSIEGAGRGLFAVGDVPLGSFLGFFPGVVYCADRLDDITPQLGEGGPEDWTYSSCSRPDFALVDSRHSSMQVGSGQHALAHHLQRYFLKLQHSPPQGYEPEQTGFFSRFKSRKQEFIDYEGQLRASMTSVHWGMRNILGSRLGHPFANAHMANHPPVEKTEKMSHEGPSLSRVAIDVPINTPTTLLGYIPNQYATPTAFLSRSATLEGLDGSESFEETAAKVGEYFGDIREDELEGSLNPVLVMRASGVIANRDIGAGEELTLDYSLPPPSQDFEQPPWYWDAAEISVRTALTANE